MLPWLIGGGLLMLLASRRSSGSAAKGRGDGVFYVGGLPKSAGEWARGIGASWVAPQGFVQKSGGGVASFMARDAYAAAREAGVEVWPWCWPQPGRHVEFWERADALLDAGCAGVLVDAERPFYAGAGKLSKGQAREAMAELMQGAASRPHGVCTYGAPVSWHPGFPWEQYAAPWVLPMVYRSTAAAVTSTVSSQRNLYPNSRFTPIVSVALKHDAKKLKSLFELCRTRYGSVAVWQNFYMRGRGLHL